MFGIFGDGIYSSGSLKISCLEILRSRDCSDFLSLHKITLCF